MPVRFIYSQTVDRPRTVAHVCLCFCFFFLFVFCAFFNDYYKKGLNEKRKSKQKNVFIKKINRTKKTINDIMKWWHHCTVVFFCCSFKIYVWKSTKYISFQLSLLHIFFYSFLKFQQCNLAPKLYERNLL